MKLRLKLISAIQLFSYSAICLSIFSCVNKSAEIILDPDINNSQNNLGIMSNTHAYTGEYSILLSSENQYGLTSKEISVKGGDRLLGKMFGFNSCNLFNLFAHGRWGHYYASSPIRKCDVDEWSEIDLMIKVPDSVAASTIVFYAYYYGNDTAYIDNLIIKKQSKPFYQDTIPEFIGIPLTHQLLKELNLNGQFPTESNFLSLVKNDSYRQVFDFYDISIEDYTIYFQQHPQLFETIKQYAEKQRIIPLKPKITAEYSKIAGYTDNLVYDKGKIVNVHILDNKGEYSAQLFRLGENYTENSIANIGKFKNKTFTVSTNQLDPENYGIKVFDKLDTFNIPLIINEKEAADIIVLAPITTWHAYNDYKGKSFYRNRIDAEPVYQISTNRPLLSADFDSVFLGHDYYIFDNICKYFSSKGNVKIYPDYYLEKHPEFFDQAKTIVLAQHCEYFSPKMYQKLLEISNTKNLISMGGNQVYWKVRFNDDFTEIECRKDDTFFELSLIPGGLWRSNLTSEAKILGVAYTDAGYATYEPYKVVQFNHWLFNGMNDRDNLVLFGTKGIDNRGISGDEMDKMDKSSPKNTILIAKGTNPNNGGGEMVIIEKDSIATLSTGSIASGSGLNVDSIFTTIISNFLKKYHF